MNTASEVMALRRSAAWTRAGHVTCLRLEGDDAFEVLDRICPAELFLRDGRMLATLLLDEAGRVAADLCLAMDDEDFFLLLEGMSAAGFLEYVGTHVPQATNFRVVDLSTTHELIAINGPFAWEVLAELVGPEVVGLPYMTFFHQGEWTCFRAGKTGEFGYDILAPRPVAAHLVEKFGELAPALDLCEASLEALDLCALENWFFNIRREGSQGLTPLELQLQWRLSRQKDFVGSAALAAHRHKGIDRRLVTVLSGKEIVPEATVEFEDRTIGKIVNAGYSPSRQQWVGLALLDCALAYPGIRRFTAGGVDLHTVAPPVLNNLSLFVSPQIHCYQTRDEVVTPGLVKEYR